MNTTIHKCGQNLIQPPRLRLFRQLSYLTYHMTGRCSSLIARQSAGTTSQLVTDSQLLRCARCVYQHSAADSIEAARGTSTTQVPVLYYRNYSRTFKGWQLQRRGIAAFARDSEQPKTVVDSCPGFAVVILRGNSFRLFVCPPRHTPRVLGVFRSVQARITTAGACLLAGWGWMFCGCL